MNDKDILTTRFKFKEKYKRAYNTPIHDLYHMNSELNKYTTYEFVDGISNAMDDNLFLYECFDNRGRIIDNHDDEKHILLPSPNVGNFKVDFFKTLMNRRSLRNFSGESISLNDLSTLLMYSSGVTGHYDTKGHNKPESSLLAYPLAGGIKCLDIYISIKSVENIDRGLYSYNSEEHSLYLTKGEDEYNYDDLTVCIDISKSSSMVIYITGSLDYLGYKYGDRAYRFMLLEAGHLAQNIYLVSTALNLGVVASGGYLDEEIRKVIGSKEKYILYEIFIGKINKDSLDPRFLD